MKNYSFYHYAIVFLVTLGLFVLAFFLSDRVSNARISQIQEIQNKISLDILSIETRYALLGNSSCDHVVSNENFERELNEELNNLARRVKFMESDLGSRNPNLFAIKQQYNLLQIKDYLLRQELNERCGEEIVSLLYFHEQSCRDCRRQTVVLDEIGIRYPEVRIYWLDRDLDTPAMQTLVSIFGVSKSPAVMIGGVVHTGLFSLAEIEEMLPVTLVEEYYALQNQDDEDDEDQEGDEREDEEKQ
jgi:glutaredoxin